MSAVLIIDAAKSSLVMTSEVFKDKIPGVNIFVARSGEEALNVLEQNAYAMVVVDFDLPDTDGVTLTKVIRRTYKGPILITAFPEEIVEVAIKKELFAYHDACDWVKKPLKFEEFSAKIDHYMTAGRRIRKRYHADIGATVVGKGAGRGKRAPKVKGNIINLSIAGALLKVDDASKMKLGDEVTIELSLTGKAAKGAKSASASKTASAKKASTKATATLDAQNAPSKIKAKIAWTSKAKKQAGVLFEQLSDGHMKFLESILKNSKELPSSQPK